MIKKVSKESASPYGSKFVKAMNYALPDLNTSIVYAELTGEHGEIKTSKRNRIYYILEGWGEFTSNGEKIFVEKGDIIIIPPNTSYNYKAIDSTLKVLLFMELFYVKKFKNKQ